MSNSKNPNVGRYKDKSGRDCTTVSYRSTKRNETTTVWQQGTGNDYKGHLTRHNPDNGDGVFHQHGNMSLPNPFSSNPFKDMD